MTTIQGIYVKRRISKKSYKFRKYLLWSVVIVGSSDS